MNEDQRGRISLLIDDLEGMKSEIEKLQKEGVGCLDDAIDYVANAITDLEGVLY